MSYANTSILVVDDEESNRDILSRRLIKEGYAVTVAEGGKQALDMLRLERYDLVLLDIMMPGIDGYEVLRRIRAEPVLHDIPVIMVTALGDESSIKRCLALGATDYVGKPFELTFLKSRIRQAILALSNLRRSNAETVTPAATILVVEDDEVNRDLLARRLGKAGYTTHVAANGVEALKLINQHVYDLILLDIMMAQLDGYQILQKIRTRDTFKDTPIIMISALADAASIARSMELGANDYIMKPYNGAILNERVVKVLSNQRGPSVN
ncbi:MAG: response regulator [Gammaproteobacteria bacterium]|jgi:CheY-like chemotaxis protein